MRWDIFCRVIDNFGDIGVSLRLARQLAQRGADVRFWIDDAGALAWMAPRGAPGVAVRALADAPHSFEARDVVVSAFDCPLPAAVLARLARARPEEAHCVPWINLEYLSAEPYAARSHGLASPVHGGAAAGVHKWFFFPGFTPATGGVLREPGLLEERAGFERAAWLGRQGIDWRGEPVVSLFCYEPPALTQWLAQLARAPALLLVTAGRAAQALRTAMAALPASWNRDGALRISFLPALEQDAYDRLLWSCDCNCVRGEDSLVRALWAGAALVWQAYPQSDGAHLAKVNAFLDWLQAPPALRAFYAAWNGTGALPLPPVELAAWAQAVRAARARLAAQDDLASRLLRFVMEKR